MKTKTTQSDLIIKFSYFLILLYVFKPRIAQQHQVNSFSFLANVLGMCHGFAFNMLNPVAETPPMREQEENISEAWKTLSTLQMFSLLFSGKMTQQGKKYSLHELMGYYHKIRYWQWMQLERNKNLLYLQNQQLARVEDFYGDRHLKNLKKVLHTDGLYLFRVLTPIPHAISIKKTGDVFFLSDSEISCNQWIEFKDVDSLIGCLNKNYYSALWFSSATRWALATNNEFNFYNDQVRLISKQPDCPPILQTEIAKYFNGDTSQKNLVIQIIEQGTDLSPQFYDYFIEFFKKQFTTADFNRLLYNVLVDRNTVAFARLISLGADWQIVQHEGMNSLELALNYERNDIAQVILQRSAIKQIKSSVLHAVTQDKNWFIPKLICAATHKQINDYRELFIEAAAVAASQSRMEVLSQIPILILNETLKKFAGNTKITNNITTVILNKINPNYPLRPRNLFQHFFATRIPTPQEVVTNMTVSQRDEMRGILITLKLISPPKPPVQPRSRLKPPPPPPLPRTTVELNSRCAR